MAAGEWRWCSQFWRRPIEPAAYGVRERASGCRSSSVLLQHGSSGAFVHRYYVLPLGRYPGWPYLARTITNDSPTFAAAAVVMGANITAVRMTGKGSVRIPVHLWGIRTAGAPAMCRPVDTQYRSTVKGAKGRIDAGQRPSRGTGLLNLRCCRITGKSSLRSRPYGQKRSAGGSARVFFTAVAGWEVCRSCSLRSAVRQPNHSRQGKVTDP